jgi:hypothetical protein
MKDKEALRQAQGPEGGSVGLRRKMMFNKREMSIGGE